MEQFLNKWVPVCSVQVYEHAGNVTAASFVLFC